MEEKRKYIRIEAPIAVSYKLAGKPLMARETIARNFSEGGIHLPVFERLNVGASLELRMEAPFDTMALPACGEVVWVKPLGREEVREAYDIGAKFTEVQPYDKKRLVRMTEDFLTMGKRYRAA